MDKEIHRGKPINLEEVMAKAWIKSAIKFRKYDDGYTTTYVMVKKYS